MWARLNIKPKDKVLSKVFVLCNALVYLDISNKQKFICEIAEYKEEKTDEIPYTSISWSWCTAGFRSW